MLRMIQQSKETMDALKTQVDITTNFIGLKQDDKEDTDNIGGLKKNVQKALREGKYVDLIHFWDKATAVRRQEMLGGQSKVREARDMEWTDWTLAMMNLAESYQAEDQGNLCIQVTNLLKAAMVESAIMTRQSDHECLRGFQAISDISNRKWGNDPLESKQARNLLTHLTQFLMRKRSQHPRMKSHVDNTNQNDTLSRPQICKVWWNGGDCQYSPCRFAHNCIQCGRVKTHILSRCTGAGQRQRT